jgi:SNF2 family DNA or RNA helicase
MTVEVVIQTPNGHKQSIKISQTHWKQTISLLPARKTETKVCCLKPYCLFPYQVDVVRWWLWIENGGFLFKGGVLWMEMGLGKTFCAATVIASTIVLQRRTKGNPTLYVCPKNILGTTQHEFTKFFGHQLRVLVYHKASHKNVSAQQIQEYDVVITNYSSVVSHYRQKTNFFHLHPWFRIVLDESHEIRNKRTIKFKALFSLCSERRFCMTGTPIHNEISDIYHQLEFSGLRLPAHTTCDHDTLEKLDLMKSIKVVNYSHAENIKLPPCKIHFINYSLKDKERTLQQIHLSRTQSVFRDWQHSHANGIHIHTCMLHMIQLCTAPYLLPISSKQVSGSQMLPWLLDRRSTAGIHSSKMCSFTSLMQTFAIPYKVVVFANFTSSLELAIDAMIYADPLFPKKYVFVHGKIASTQQRETRFAQFRGDPNISCLFMTLKIGCVGLNLTVADKIIFLEPWYSHAALSQAIARVHRIGQIKPVSVYHLLGQNTVEQRVYQIAQEKHALSSSTMTHGRSEQDT